jgi:HPt (histidine-containing phosphotransfer) domain-containing protein
MATAVKNAKPLNHKELVKECDDEPSLVIRYLEIFVKATQLDMDCIAESLRKNELPGIAKLAHRIKGASASIRAEFLRAEAEQMEMLAGKGDSAGLKKCFSRLQAEFENFTKFIATLPTVSN